MPSTFHDNWTPTSPNQLIAESWHDCEFVRAVSKHHGVPSFQFTAPVGEDKRPLGKSGFKRHLTAMLLWTNRGLVKNIVVVGDNDDDHAASLSDIRKAFQDARGYPTPHVDPCRVATNGRIRIGVLMLPEAGKNGCLETRLLDSAIQNQATLACVDAFAACCGYPPFPQNNFHKFKLRSLLTATIQTEPNITLSGIWSKAENPIDASDPKFKWIADFLNVVFV